ncbi:hypothetical protein F4777DRAFT_595978 [Nemania sp. FL0916]|nr:hypothetical protein F4777DRAFT_595978 [Nemania sp. FL0916]
MGLFYAYVVDDKNNSNYVWVITFKDRAAADEWWRFLENQSTPGLRRLSPQFYKYDFKKPISNLMAVQYGTEPADRQMFITITNQGGISTPLIPSEVITDHINRGSYFIRSQSRPEIYWALRANGYVCATAAPIARAKFKISMIGDHRRRVMIDSDDVEITSKRRQDEDVKIQTDDAGLLQFGREGDVFKFGDLNRGFRVCWDRVGPDEPSRGEKFGWICKSDYLGEIWELTH